jgi:hypothetical protein
MGCTLIGREQVPNDGGHKLEPEKGSTAIRDWVVNEMFTGAMGSAE